VEKILKNEFYTGVFYWKDRKYENASHKPLVSRELFRQVQQHLIRPNKQKSRKDLFAYTNLISCGVCNSSVTAEIKKERYIYYHCTGNKGKCNQPYVREEVIDESVVSLLEDMHVPDDIQEMILNGMRESLQTKIEYHNTCVEQIEQQMRLLQNRIDQSYLDKLDKKIDEDFWMTQNRKWLSEKEDLSIKLVSFQKADASYLEHVGLIIELAKKASRLFKQADTSQKRKLVKMLVSNCSLKDGKLDLELKSPFDKIFVSSKTRNWRPTVDYFRTSELDNSIFGIKHIFQIC
jgi:site-specific DNA recombinase